MTDRERAVQAIEEAWHRVSWDGKDTEQWYEAMYDAGLRATPDTAPSELRAALERIAGLPAVLMEDGDVVVSRAAVLGIVAGGRHRE